MGGRGALRFFGALRASYPARRAHPATVKPAFDSRATRQGVAAGFPRVEPARHVWTGTTQSRGGFGVCGEATVEEQAS